MREMRNNYFELIKIFRATLWGLCKDGLMCWYSNLLKRVSFIFCIVFLIRLIFSVFFVFLEDFCCNLWFFFEEFSRLCFRLFFVSIDIFFSFFSGGRVSINKKVMIVKKYFFTIRQLLLMYLGSKYFGFCEKFFNILFFLFFDIIAIVVLYHFCAYLELYLVFFFFIYIYIVCPLTYLFFSVFRLFFKLLIRIVVIWPIKAIIFVIRYILKFFFGINFKKRSGADERETKTTYTSTPFVEFLKVNRSVGKEVRFTLFWWFNKFERFIPFCIFYELFIGDYFGSFFFNAGYLESGDFYGDYFTSEKWFKLFPVLIFDYFKIIGFNSFFAWLSKIIYMFFSMFFGVISSVFYPLILFLFLVVLFLALFFLFHLFYVAYMLVYGKFNWLFFRFFSERYWFLKDYSYGQAIIFFFCFFLLHLVNISLYVSGFFRYITRTHGVLLDRLEVPDSFEEMVKVMDVNFFSLIFNGLSYRGYFYFLFGTGVELKYKQFGLDLKKNITNGLFKKRRDMYNRMRDDKVYKYLFKDIYFDKRLVNLRFSKLGGYVLNRKTHSFMNYGEFRSSFYYGVPLIPTERKIKGQYKAGEERMFDYVRLNRWNRYYYYRLGYLKNLRNKYKDMFINFEKSETAAENLGKVDPNIFENPRYHFMTKLRSIKRKFSRYAKYQNPYEYDYFFFHFKKVFTEPINELFFYSNRVLDFFAFWDKKVSRDMFVDYYELDTERDLFKTIKNVKWGTTIQNGDINVSSKWRREYKYRIKKVRDRLVGRLVLSYLSNYFKYLLRLIVLQNFLYKERKVRLHRKYFFGPAIFLYARYSLLHLILRRLVYFISYTFLGDNFIVRIGSERLFFNFFKLGVVYIDIMSPIKFVHYCVTAPFAWFYESFVKDWLLDYYEKYVEVEDFINDLDSEAVDDELEDIDNLYTRNVTLFSRYFLRLSSWYQADVNFDLDAEDDNLYDTFVGDMSNAATIAHTNANEATLIKTHGFNGSLYDNDSRYLEQDGVITPFLFANNAYLQTVLLDFYFVKDSIISFFQRIFYMIFFNKIMLIFYRVVREIFFFSVLWYLILIYFWCMFWLFFGEFVLFCISFVFAWISFFFNVFINIVSDVCTKCYIVDIILIVYTAPFLVKQTRFWLWLNSWWRDLRLIFGVFFVRFCDQVTCFLRRNKSLYIKLGVGLFTSLKFFAFLGFRLFLFYVLFFVLIVNYDNIYDFVSLKLYFNLSFRTFFLLYMIIFYFFLVLCVGPLTKIGRWLWDCRYDYLFIVFTLWVLSAYIVSMDLLFVDFWANFDYKSRLYGVDFYENLLETVGDFTQWSLLEVNSYNQQFSFDSYHISLEENVYDYLAEYGFFDYNLVKLFSATIVYNNFDTLERSCALGLVYVPDLVFEKELNNFYKALYYKMAFKDYSMALWFDYVHSPSYFMETYDHQGQRWNVPEVLEATTEHEALGWDTFDLLYWDREATTIIFPYFLTYDRGDDIRHYWTIIQELYDLDVVETEFFRGRSELRAYYIPDFSFLGSQAWSYSIAIMQKDPIYLVDSLFMDDDESWFYDEEYSG